MDEIEREAPETRAVSLCDAASIVESLNAENKLPHFGVEAAESNQAGLIQIGKSLLCLAYVI